MADKKQAKEEKIVVAKNAAELQKIRLEKLMKNPNKLAHIPEKSKDYKPREPLEFVRNIWGSSAGAGSGDFHVYRGVRRREYARQKFAKEKNEKEEADEVYHQKVEANEKAAEERTAKKRAKRLKKKQKQKNKKLKKDKESSDEDEEEDDNEEETKEETKERISKTNDNEVDQVASETENTENGDACTENVSEPVDKNTGDDNVNGEDLEKTSDG